MSDLISMYIQWDFDTLVHAMPGTDPSSVAVHLGLLTREFEALANVPADVCG